MNCRCKLTSDGNTPRTANTLMTGHPQADIHYALPPAPEVAAIENRKDVAAKPDALRI